MKKLLLVLALCCLMLVLIDAAKHKNKKEKWRGKKHLSKKLGHHNKMDKDGVDYSAKKHHYKMAKKYHKKQYNPKKQMWRMLKIKSAKDCGIKCAWGEVCISGPVESKPMCIRKKDLKRSMKLFHRYQKKEMKAWKKFKKDKYNDVDDETYYAKFDKKDMADLKKKHLASIGYSDHIKKSKGKHSMKAFSKGVKAEGCTTSEFSQMRTRLMGWFHLLHGADHLSKKKEQGTSLKKFHKHMSVKKELREHDGLKCECFKSAMWQFKQIDKNGDDFLTEPELSPMEENSLEPCMRPYLTSCDQDGDMKLSSNEWCCCFANVVAPCFKKLDDIQRSGDTAAYKPRCDKEGYYMREQCMGDKCWCVDYNGNELKGSATEGRAHCTKKALLAQEKKDKK